MHVDVRPSPAAPVVSPYPQTVLFAVSDGRPGASNADEIAQFNQVFFGQRPSGFGEAARVLWNEYQERRRRVGANDQGGGAVQVRLVPTYLSDP